MRKQLTINYDWYSHWNTLSETEKELVSLAQNCMSKAYAPYSQFKVGASVLLENGQIICGNNQENIAYPSGTCAERVALFYANANYPAIHVETIVIVAEGDLISPEMCISPCGSCRQVIAESEQRQGKEISIVLVAQNGETWRFSSIKDLLVFPFGVKN